MLDARDKARVTELYARGFSARSVAERLGLTKRQVLYCLRTQGAKRRSKREAAVISHGCGRELESLVVKLRHLGYKNKQIAWRLSIGLTTVWRITKRVGR